MILSSATLCWDGSLVGHAINDVYGVDDIAQRLGHLAPMCIAYHGVQVHLAEGDLACTGSSAHIKLAVIMHQSDSLTWSAPSLLGLCYADMHM